MNSLWIFVEFAFHYFDVAGRGGPTSAPQKPLVGHPKRLRELMVKKIIRLHFGLGNFGDPSVHRHELVIIRTVLQSDVCSLVVVLSQHVVSLFVTKLLPTCLRGVHRYVRGFHQRV